MWKNLRKKLFESFISVFPLAALVVVIDLIFVGSGVWDLAMFTIGASGLVLGLSLFTLGADIAMIPIGSQIGGYLSKHSNKLILVLLIVFVLGFIVTAAEPDLHVLARQATENNTLNYSLLLCVAVGVGLFFAVSIIKKYFAIPLKYVLFALYGIMFVIAAIMPGDFLAVSLDSGSVTTGPITVPFLMAFGMSMTISKVKDGEDSGFGTLALCSIGPIIVMMLLSLTGTLHVASSSVIPAGIENFNRIMNVFGEGFKESAVNILIPLVPIAAIFFVFQIFALKLPAHQVIRITMGLVYTYLGLTLFLTGAETGFMHMGRVIGAALGSQENKIVLVPLGMLIGAFIALAEPAVYVLNKQVEEVTGGAISRKIMLLCLTIGIALSAGLSILRVITGLSIWYFIVPTYGASLILMFFVPPLFTGIAFDSGGVASGSLTSAFLAPLCIGMCAALGGNALTDAFGSMAFVAMTPLLVIQLLGLLYKIKLSRVERLQVVKLPRHADEENWQESEQFKTVDFDEPDMQSMPEKKNDRPFRKSGRTRKERRKESDER